MTNFEMLLKNPDYQHIIRESLISECAVGTDNHLHLCRDLQCEECMSRQEKKSGYFNCCEHTKKWLDEEFRPVFEKKETTSTKDMLVSEIDDDGDLILVKRR